MTEPLPAGMERGAVFHDSRKNLKIHPEQTWNHIGVLVSNPRPNHAGLGGIASIDWQTEYPTIWPHAIGGSIPFEQRAAKTQEELKRVIEKIDECIEELVAHRVRLVEHLGE